MSLIPPHFPVTGVGCWDHHEGKKIYLKCKKV